MPTLLRFFGLQESSPAERRAAAWIAAMFFLAMASTSLLRPLRDQFGVQRGVEYLPYLYSLTLLATAIAVVPFWWLANRMTSRRFVPIVIHVCTALVAAFALGVAAIGEYEWKRVSWLGEAFWGGFSAFNVVAPALVWIHAVEHFGAGAARRVFGLIAIGGTLGVVCGSYCAGVMTAPVADGGLGWLPWRPAVASALLLQAMWLAFRGSLRACSELGGGAPRVAHGGVLEGVRILAHSGRARAIGVYMMLLGVLATAFASAQTELVGSNVGSSRGQHVWLADVEFWGQSLVLVLQLLCTGRLLQRWPASVLLVSLPVVSILGLGALWLAPTLLTINIVQIGRRGTQYAFEKPAREVLYTPLSLATKHKVKFLLDTFAFRLGDLFGACLAVGLRDWRLGTGGSAAITIVVALAWIALGIALGRRPRAEAEPAAEAADQRASTS